MTKQIIRELIEQRIDQDGLVETGINRVQLFRATHPIPCAPAVYEPCVVVIVSGSKEAILDGQKFLYDSDHYLCCPTSLPVQAGTPDASVKNPLLGVLVSLDVRLVTKLAIDMDRATGASQQLKGPQSAGLSLARWDPDFTDAMLRLLQLGQSSTDTAILGESRLLELYYAILKGDAGANARRVFGVGNEITRAISLVTSNLEATVTIDDMASHVGMSRAVFHRRFKEATTMSPIQFVKSMRLNSAAMKIASGMTVGEAAMQVGYNSTSQFSREFKRLYGASPKQWGSSVHLQIRSV